MRCQKIHYRGKAVRVDDSYDNVLCVYAAYEDEKLSDADKIDIAAYRLVKGQRLYLKALTDMWKAELVEKIMKECIILPEKPIVRHTSERSLDFWLDKEYIYSSFQKDYGIDLIKQQGKLPWKKFIALFQGLSDNTKIREIMKIRMLEMPAYNGRNGKEIREIQELKSYYALPVKGRGGQDGLNRLFAALEAQAVGNG